MDDKGQIIKNRSISKEHNFDTFVLEKGIFSNVFEKDIRRIYIYKKAERLARAVHLIAPAFASSVALRRRADEIAIGLIDAAVLPPLRAKEILSRELLALSSLLSFAHTGGLLSSMNANLIAHESHVLLEEIAHYEEPRITLGEFPTLSELAREVPKKDARVHLSPRSASGKSDKGHISDKPVHGERKQSIIAVLKERGPSYIKDISSMVRGVSEKTIQRELQALVNEGAVKKQGERRWTRYFLEGAMVHEDRPSYG